VKGVIMQNQDIPGLILGLRERLGLTQEQFAQRVGVTYSTVNHWENGKRMPQPFLLRRLLQLQEQAENPAVPSARIPDSGTGPSGVLTDRRQEGEGSQGTIREMVQCITRLFHPEKIILFGSHARGEATPDSDVDLLVIMRVEGSKRETQLRVREALHDVRVPKDVIVSTPEEFRWRQKIVGTIERQAVREGVVQYAGG
jgi:transcriptional regulator with XRE-family HTH domain